MRGRQVLTAVGLGGAFLAGAVGYSGASTAKIWVGHAKEFEAFLETADIVSIEELGTGANNPKRVTLRRGPQTLRALWKPILRGPKESGWESYETEIAAYQVDRMLGLDMVPPTVLREIDGQEGSLQMWMEGFRLYEEVEHNGADAEAWERQMSHMRVFDTLIGNKDRDARNYMVDDAWNVVLIDHSQAFSASHYIEDQMKEMPSRFDRKQIERAKRWDVEFLTFRFGRLLMRPQVQSMIARRDALVRYIDGLVATRGGENVWLAED